MNSNQGSISIQFNKGGKTPTLVRFIEKNHINYAGLAHCSESKNRRRINSPPNRPTKIHLCLGLSVHRSIGRLLSFVGTCEKLNGQRVKICEWGRKGQKVTLFYVHDDIRPVCVTPFDLARTD